LHLEAKGKDQQERKMQRPRKRHSQYKFWSNDNHKKEGRLTLTLFLSSGFSFFLGSLFFSESKREN
jgi:hypothetical protein